MWVFLTRHKTCNSIKNTCLLFQSTVSNRHCEWANIPPTRGILSLSSVSPILQFWGLWIFISWRNAFLLVVINLENSLWLFFFSSETWKRRATADKHSLDPCVLLFLRMKTKIDRVKSETWEEQGRRQLMNHREGQTGTPDVGRLGFVAVLANIMSTLHLHKVESSERREPQLWKCLYKIWL